MDISKMNITELKALAFDLFVQKGNIDAALKTVNDRMNELSTMQTPGEVIAETKSEEPKEESTESVDKSE